jgi:ABC-type uncharacterized transport system permease subunit
MPDSLCRGADMDTLRIYFKLVGMALKSMTQFRIDFLVGVVGVIAQNGVNLAAIGVILGRFHDLAGWTVWEICNFSAKMST